MRRELKIKTSASPESSTVKLALCCDSLPTDKVHKEVPSWNSIVGQPLWWDSCV